MSSPLDKVRFHMNKIAISNITFGGWLVIRPTISPAQEMPSNAGPLYARSLIDNTFGTGGSHGGKWVQDNIVSMWVASDGRCYTASSWDEGKCEAGIYKDGESWESFPISIPIKAAVREILPEKRRI